MQLKIQPHANMSGIVWTWELLDKNDVTVAVVPEDEGFYSEQEARDSFNAVRHAFMCVMA